MKKVWMPLALALALSACATPNQQAVPRVPFPVSEYDALPKTGTGSLAGQVFMRTMGGDVKFGAGSDVHLQPVTAYTQQWYTVNYLEGRPLEPADPRALQGTLVTQADGSGNFSFTNVPPGRYFLSSKVQWQAPTQFGLLPQGGVVAKIVTISDGVQAREMLTK
ncbi:hypothetical protein D884_03195 [Pseudomonas sp. URMO17WK12:I10]|uniref:hypothetical protein n=1 Tax=unclassified Pseudomonas TaxID=196821 RepID=UPI0004891DB9|nr:MULTISPECIES: hypothetical protein [unclassified Pseudomonas]RDL17054.1 hypothetical protein F633_03467 [Pseudomonas sp. LAMO17WK12:I3]RED05084.1 hypothetical protein D884_03195 [Pseudomonas sp. URMO17WK12:I10]SOD08470.1 hypothetical protein SAMN05660967_01679 [Pseudomonas sp. URMO17WK12:I9]